MRVDADLLTLLRTGRFGPVALGSSVAEVRAQLGEPDLHHQGIDRLDVLRYCGIELHFRSDALYMFWNDRAPFNQVASESVTLDPWLLAGDKVPSRQEVETALSKVGVVHRFVGVPAIEIASPLRIGSTESAAWLTETGMIHISGPEHVAELGICVVREVEGCPPWVPGDQLVQHLLVSTLDFMAEHLRKRTGMTET